MSDDIELLGRLELLVRRVYGENNNRPSDDVLNDYNLVLRGLVLYCSLYKQGLLTHQAYRERVGRLALILYLLGRSDNDRE